MKIVYEKKDIDTKNNPLHTFLDGQLTVSTLMWALLSSRNKRPTENEMNDIMAEVVATFLNGMESAGYELVKKESSIPTIFRDGMIEKD